MVGEDLAGRKSRQGRPKGFETKKEDMVNVEGDIVSVWGKKDFGCRTTTDYEVGNELVIQRRRLIDQRTSNQSKLDK